MKLHSLLLIALAAALLQGCSYPEPASITQKDNRPAIGIAGAPRGSILLVDGLAMGSAQRYNGKDGVLLIESGKHRVEVKSANGQVLLSEEIFLSGTTTKIFNLK